MATISKTGIQDGLTSKAEHLTRIIDALDGTATTELVATGSFTGSFTGTGTITSASYAVTASYAENAGAGAGFPFNGSAIITGSLLVSSSTVDFTDVTSITVPSPSSVNGSNNINQLYNAGTHVQVDLSSAGESHIVILPTAADSYLGTEIIFDITGIGSNSRLQISGSGENKLFGIIIAPGSATDDLRNGGLGVNFLQVNSSNSELTDTYTLRSMGSVGWKLTGVCASATAYSSSFIAG